MGNGNYTNHGPCLFDCMVCQEHAAFLHLLKVSGKWSVTCVTFPYLTLSCSVNTNVAEVTSSFRHRSRIHMQYQRPKERPIQFNFPKGSEKYFLVLHVL